MPSHFHSACHSATSPRSSGAPSSGWARKNGYGRLDVGVAGVRRDERVVERRRRLPRRPSAGGRSRRRQTPLTWARARVTSSCDTPTRNAPVMSLFQTNRCRWSIAAHAASTVGLLPLLGGVAEREQHLVDPVGQRPVGRGVGGGQQQGDRLGQVADGVAALVEQPLGDAGQLGGPGRSLLRRAPPAAACGRTGSRRPRRRRRAGRRRSSGPARRPCRWSWSSRRGRRTGRRTPSLGSPSGSSASPPRTRSCGDHVGVEALSRGGPAHHRREPVRRPSTRVTPAFLDGGQQAGPVGVVGQDEAAVDGACAAGPRGPRIQPEANAVEAGRTSATTASRGPTAGRRPSPRPSRASGGAALDRLWSAAARRRPRGTPGSSARPPRACRSGRCRVDAGQQPLGLAEGVGEEDAALPASRFARHQALISANTSCRRCPSGRSAGRTSIR